MSVTCQIPSQVLCHVVAVRDRDTCPHNARSHARLTAKLLTSPGSQRQLPSRQQTLCLSTSDVSTRRAPQRGRSSRGNQPLAARAASKPAASEEECLEDNAWASVEGYQTLYELLGKEQADVIIADDQARIKMLQKNGTRENMLSNWKAMVGALGSEEAALAVVKKDKSGGKFLWYKHPQRLAQHLAVLEGLVGPALLRQLVAKHPNLLLNRPQIAQACWDVVVSHEGSAEAARELVVERPYLLRGKLYESGSSADARVLGMGPALEAVASGASKARAAARTHLQERVGKASQL